MWYLQTTLLMIILIERQLSPHFRMMRLHLYLLYVKYITAVYLQVDALNALPASGRF